jgi:hypothetical protein
LAERPALPSIRVKLPSEGERDFLLRYAPTIASKGLTIPTANLRAVGSRIRLTLELKSGEVVSGEAVVESHLVTATKKALLVRFLALDEGSIVFPFSADAAASPAAAPAEPEPSAARPPAPAPRPAAAPSRRGPGGDLEELFGPEGSDAAPAGEPERGPATGADGEQGRGPSAAGEEAGRLPGPPAYADEPGPGAARRRGALLAAGVVIAALAVAGVLAAVRAYRGTSAGTPPAAKPADVVAPLLAAADRDIAAGRLSGPESALAVLVKARTVAPADPRVGERLKLLADTFEAFAARALERGDAREAGVHLDAAEQADPGRPSLAEKRARLESLPAPDASGR